MKVKLAVKILLLACTTISGRASCPVAKNATPLALKNNSSVSYVKFAQNEADVKQNSDSDRFEIPAPEDNSLTDREKIVSHRHSSKNKIELLESTVVPIDLSHPKPAFSDYIIIEMRKAVFVTFSHPPLPDRSIAAFIRNGILKV